MAHSGMPFSPWIAAFFLWVKALAAGAREQAKGVWQLGRFDKPVGIWLLAQPGLWAIAMAAPSLQGGFFLSLLFLLGAVVMRAAGCTLNDFFDRKIDAKVERTKLRPLACGALSYRAAFLFLFLMLSVGFCILLQLPVSAFILGCAVLPLIALYPLMKRITYWPQLFLGLVFNWGVWLGAASALNLEIEPMQDLWLLLWPLLLYAGCVLWTLGYDTIYAAQDVADDAKIGVRSSALRLGKAIKPFVFLCYGLALLFWLMAAIHAQLGGLFYPLWMILFVMLFYACQRWQPQDGLSSLNAFKANVPAGWLLWMAILAGRL